MNWDKKTSVIAGVIALICAFGIKLWSDWDDQRSRTVEARVYVVDKRHAVRTLVGVQVIAIPVDTFDTRLAAANGEVQTGLGSLREKLEDCSLLSEAYLKDWDKSSFGPVTCISEGG